MVTSFTNAFTRTVASSFFTIVSEASVFLRSSSSPLSGKLFRAYEKCSAASLYLPSRISA